VEKRETDEYQVEFTTLSRHYFYEVLDYLYQNYTIDRAEQLANELESMAKSLNHHPHRGTKEKWLLDMKQEYRFILFNRTQRSDIKIIYYIQKSGKKVYVTDFFPTEMDNEQIASRNFE